MRRLKLGMDKKGWRSLSILVPPDQYDHYKVMVYRKVARDTKNPLYLYIRANPQATIRQVMNEFQIRQRKQAVINFCYNHGLTLFDLPPKSEKK